jgi:hypothetical protein
VFAFPQNNGYVPSIRVAGKWLAEMGFACGDRVKLTAENGKITIQKQPLQEGDYGTVRHLSQALESRKASCNCFELF